MNCEIIWYYTFTDFWLMTRKQDYRTNPATATKYQELLATASKKYGIKLEELIEGNQSDCDYDYIELYPDGPSFV